MPSYTLTNNASDIDSALSRVVAAETVPSTASQNMVTSGGVKNYVDTEVSALDTRLTTAESGITALQAGLKVARYSRAALTSYTSTSVIQLTEDSDPDNIGTALTSGTYGGGVQVGAGTYLITCTGEFYEEDQDNDDYFLVNLRSSGTTLLSERINETEDGAGGDYDSVNIIYVLTVPVGSTSDVNIQYQRVSGASGSSRNVSLTLVKLG
jgi:hypothetical protein